MTITTSTWRPKLTPYRTLVLFITIGSGSAKAYAAFRNLELVTTTIEWIAGVVLFSIIFILGAYESDPPHPLAYFFQHDLARYPFKRVLCCTTHDASEDDIPIGYKDDITNAHPLITGYRLLVTVAVASFGLVKAYFAYQGLPQEANAIDWIYGVVLTSCLYVLGLYEDNPGGLMPYLFFFDFAPVLLTALVLAALILGLFLSFAWAAYMFQILLYPFPDIRDVFNGTNKLHSIHQAPTTVFQGIHNVTQFGTTILSCILLSSMGVLVVFGVIVQFLFLFEASGAVAGAKETIWGFFSACFTRSARVASAVLPVYKFRRLARFLRRFSLHILVYSAGIVIPGVIAFNLVGIISILWYEVNAPSVFTYLFATYFTIIALFPFFLICLVCFQSFIMLIAPFLVDWEAPEYQRTFLEL